MTFKKFLAEAEQAATQPVTGDILAISINEVSLIEASVVSHTSKNLTIELDETAVSLLENCGCKFSEAKKVTYVADRDFEITPGSEYKGYVMGDIHRGEIGQRSSFGVYKKVGEKEIDLLGRATKQEIYELVHPVVDLSTGAEPASGSKIMDFYRSTVDALESGKLAPKPITIGEDFNDDEEFDDEEEQSNAFYVVLYNFDKNTTFIGEIEKSGGRWYESTVSGQAPYAWGGSKYMSYLTPNEIISWLNKDYGRGYEVFGPFDSDVEASDFAHEQLSSVEENSNPLSDIRRLAGITVENDEENERETYSSYDRWEAAVYKMHPEAEITDGKRDVSGIQRSIARVNGKAIGYFVDHGDPRSAPGAEGWGSVSKKSWLDEDEEEVDYVPRTGDIVKIDYPTEHLGMLGEIIQVAPSGRFAVVQFKNGDVASYHESDLVKATDEEEELYYEQESEEIDDYHESVNDIRRLAGMIEGDVISNKFAARQAAKNKTPYRYSSDIAADIPKYDPKRNMSVSPAHQKGHEEPFVKFEVAPVRGNIVEIIGITKDGKRVKVSTSNNMELMKALADAYNRGGFTDQDIEKIPLSRTESIDESKVGDKFVIVHKDSKKVLSSHDLESAAHDELDGLGDKKNEYKVVKKKGYQPKQAGMKESVKEAKYQGREVQLGKPTKGDVKKYKVYVKDPKTGNIKKVNFGDPNMEIKRDSPERRKSFRARHNCADKKDRTKAGYWSCRMWSNKPVSKIVK